MIIRIIDGYKEVKNKIRVNIFIIEKQFLIC